ncbi:hypothetical protein [Desulfatirhabdium butyrativorans]|uniref:hypothetical protein n=1 Tax=Desulfatirhabdium butyrativorans TaxID=340467 RepID=UPI000419DE5E|nr:hypothetical protein [Desulfatirhabdium butyrativorans]
MSLHEAISFALILVRWILLCILVIVAGLILLASWKLRGMFHWRRSIRQELQSLRDSANDADEPMKAAIDVVWRRCDLVWREASTGLSVVSDFPAFLRSIAACFHPETEQPELMVTVGSLLYCANTISCHLREILERPVFSRLKRIRIRHFRQAIAGYQSIRNHPLIRFSIRHRILLHRLNDLRLLVLMDPLSWAIRGMNQWIYRRTLRFFLVDMTLFVGRNALMAYGDDRRLCEQMPTERQMEAVLEEMKQMDNTEEPPLDTQLLAIRSRLLKGRLWVRSPNWTQWKSAVWEVIQHKASVYFPNSDCADEEALIIILLQETGGLLQYLAETERFGIFRRLHGVRLATLMHLGQWADSPITRMSAKGIRQAWDIYQWASLPLTVYRMARRASPAAIAWQTGWFLLQRGMLYYGGKWLFDVLTIRIDRVYRLSAMPDRHGSRIR